MLLRELLLLNLVISLKSLMVIFFVILQRIQYAKTKSDLIAKADGTFVPRERRKKHDERGWFVL